MFGCVCVCCVQCIACKPERACVCMCTCVRVRGYVLNVYVCACVFVCMYDYHMAIYKDNSSIGKVMNEHVSMYVCACALVLYGVCVFIVNVNFKGTQRQGSIPHHRFRWSDSRE